MFIPALIICISGPDKVGKETQSKLLVSYLKDRGNRVLLVETPIKSKITYPVIYWMLRNGLAKRLPNAFQFIQFLNKFAFQLKLFFLQFAYDYIVFDRWALSAIVYGDAGGANKKFNRFLYGLLKQPDATIILVGPSLTSKKVDSYEIDAKLQSDVRVGYANWHAKNTDTSVIIDNFGGREVVHKRIINALSERLFVI